MSEKDLNLDWNEIYVSPDEFLEILKFAAQESGYFNDWDHKWHPEDMYSNMESVFESVGNGLTAYTRLLGQRFRDKQRTAVFGGTIPTSALSGDSSTKYREPYYTDNRVFGDNV